MDAFSYLSVLLSIILGLAITQVLHGYRALLLSRGRVQIYLPPLIWSGLMLLFATQLWWASFDLADHRDWTFGAFGMILLQTVLLYMSTALVLPDVPAGEPVDLRSHYYREVTPFFAISLATLAVSISKDLVIDGELPDPANLAFHGVFAALALLALLIRRPRFHEAVAIAMAAMTAVYVAALFAVLGAG